MVYHIVAVPYPGRGHVNPMMNLCKSLLISSRNQILITFVVTQEWQTLINKNTNHAHADSIRICTFPNVLPSEEVRGNDFPGFYEAVMTKMEEPFEAVIDEINGNVNVDLIIADTELLWARAVATRRLLPLALLWTASASVFSMFLHHQLFLENHSFGNGEKRVDYIPGVSPLRISDLPSIFHDKNGKVLQLYLQCISKVQYAKYLLFNSIYEIEPNAIDTLKSKYSFPLYTIGPLIPFYEATNNEHINYMQWLDSQPKGSVLYISLGSYLSISKEQMEELVVGLCDSGVRFLMVYRGPNKTLLSQNSNSGLFVPWCDQLRVLSHNSIGGFLSHCGWNSVLEAMFCGVPVLTFPISIDQVPNSKQIVEDLKVGVKMKERLGTNNKENDVVMRKEIARIVKGFMDFESREGRELRERANKVLMECVDDPPRAARHEHMVVVPYPSCGHINPMMYLSNSIVSTNPNIHITFVVTQQWLPSIITKQQNNNIRIHSIPNLVSNESSPSFSSTVEAVMTKMEPAIDSLLNEIVDQPPTAIIYDAFLYWVAALANRRNIPVAAFWTTTASEFWLHSFNLLHQYHQNLLGGNSDKLVDYIPGKSWIRLADIPLLDKNNQRVLHWAMKSCESMLKSHCILLPTFYDLESKVIDAMRVKTSTPIYTVGPNIPYFSLEEENSRTRSDVDDKNVNGDGYYLAWLDTQPSNSVLYISYGSFLSVSSAQMDEIANALKISGVRFLWVIREEGSRIKEIFGNNNMVGLVVPWCDQLKVLLHPSIGGYWTHCGWNSIMEGVYGGVPFLTFPIGLDQPLISKMIVEDWMVGWRVKKDDRSDALVTSDEIVTLLRKFMQLDSVVGSGMRKRAKELQRLCHLAIAKGGSSQINIKAFLKNITSSVVFKPNG
ncbi:hypothetical protein Ahy_A01g004330 isoform A [Arachis hypogaea]|uniref:Uncharacterized protein n=2 Tax=Arachis hypogaea TaxID=3818 RepID=A0A445EVT1_ARAHY|nr:hypothetical protein Ahy_A01g004330 isoform A [Arachis hypogaea]